MMEKLPGLERFPPRTGAVASLAVFFFAIMLLVGLNTRLAFTIASSFLLHTSSFIFSPLDDGGTELQFYGQSPPVYPSPIGNGSTSPAWATAYGRAGSLVGQMMLEEKVNLTGGFPGPCMGNTGQVPRLGIPSFCLEDGPNGVRGDEFTSAFPAGIHVAATWDRELMYRYGEAIAEEFRGKGAHVALGPVAGPLGRMARGGRNWEGLSNDPYLAGAAMGTIVTAMQNVGVMPSVKHFLLNEQEWRRRPDEHGDAISANVDDRTLHELYMFPFMDGLRAGAVCVMCSYQRANNSYACQNSKLMNGLLKTELGFEGFIVSDWNAQLTGIASANAGLDMTMPSLGYWGHNLTDAVNNGSMTVDRIDDMATRILASWYYVGQDNGYPVTKISSNLQIHEPVDVQGNHASLIREIGAAGMVLVKNVNNSLPLRNPRFVCVYGYGAVHSSAPWRDPVLYGGHVGNFGMNTFPGALIGGGGSADVSPPYVISPFQAIQERVSRSRGNLRWDFESEDPSPAFANADACIVLINAYAAEKWDRTSLTDESSDRLVQNVAKNCSNTIVVIHSAGIRVVDAWIEHPNVTAVLYAGLPGQESGNSLADVLWGDVSPSGRMPYTVAKKESDYGKLLNSTMDAQKFPQDDYVEGVYIDYRAFDREGIEPRFEFGFGLSYSTFAYADLEVIVTTQPTDSNIMAPLPDPEIAVIQGGHPQLWENIATVVLSVTNTGNVTASEIVQVYVGIPDEEGDAPTPQHQLRGFDRIGPIAPGASETVEFPLTRRDLSIWDVVAQQWRLQTGAYKIFVGASSRDIRLEGTLALPLG